MTSDHPVKRRKKLIEVAIPLAEVNDEAARRNTKAPLGWPTSIHKWWAQRPIAIARAVLLAQILDDPSELPDKFSDIDAQSRERERLLGIIASFSDWDNTKNEQTYAAIEEEVNAALSRAHAAHDEVRFLDPFAGGACIPISAQLLGIYTEASDLNPISCLINLSLGEIPYRISNHFYSWAKESGMRGIGEKAIERFNSMFLCFAEIIRAPRIIGICRQSEDIKNAARKAVNDAQMHPISFD
ncbi:MAG: DUF1156 domain-containing protein, partial [Cyanobacteria bacterium K_DeepCast_35m_m2_023]|nr:DUF1156 domain-containing protein [Cyanobacteria bacterium K_DeepCast_35m_m2_023]